MKYSLAAANHRRSPGKTEGSVAPPLASAGSVQAASAGWEFELTPQRNRLYMGDIMADVSNDPIFWDVRVQERRLRRGELTEKQLLEHLQNLPDVADKATVSVPLEEPIERPPPRRPMVRITAAPSPVPSPSVC